MSTMDTGFAAPLDDDGEDFDDVMPIRRRRLPLLTRLLLVALVAAGTFVVGVEVQKHYGGTSSSSATAGSTAGSFAARRAAFGRARAGGAAGQFGGGGAAGAGGGATVGLITLIRGSTLYVTDFSGNTVKVKAAGVKVSKTVSAPLKTLRPGDSVVVQATKQKDGSLKAASIAIGQGGNG
jgi:hypothetical protein